MSPRPPSPTEPPVETPAEALDESSGEAPTGSQAVDRAAHLLTLVVRAEVEPTLADLSEQTGFAKSTVSRLVLALERNRLVARSDEGSFTAGELFAMYAVRRAHDEDLPRLVRPVLEELCELTGEAGHLAEARGDAVVFLDQIESTFILGSRDWLGVDVPVHCSALGKVLCAYGTLPLPAGRLETPTECSISTIAQLRTDLEMARDRGWAAAVDELELGLAAIAAPVQVDGRTVAAVGLSGASARLAPELDRVGAIVSAHVAALSAQLSHLPKEGAA
ncbi:MAG: IclR family transcriptional regulator [Micrococcales bacterium]|nr:IclR family transcriptional regulator [Micrococcales bacterium]